MRWTKASRLNENVLVALLPCHIIVSPAPALKDYNRPLGFRGSKQSWSGVHNILSLDGLLLRRNCFQPSEQKPCSRT